MHNKEYDKKYQERYNAERRAEKRRTLPGFPWEGKFSSLDEVKEYFGSARVQCLMCGKAYRSIGHHMPVHEMTMDEYQERFGIPWFHPTTCPEMHEARSKRCKEQSAARAEIMNEVLALARKQPRKLLRKTAPAVKRVRREALDGLRNGLVTSIKTVRHKKWEAKNQERSKDYVRARIHWFYKKDPRPLLAYAEKWNANLVSFPILREALVRAEGFEPSTP